MMAAHDEEQTMASQASAQPSDSEIIYDWNTRDADGKLHAPLTPGSFRLFDETLRDGLQSPSVYDPPIEEKLRFIELLARLGVEHLDVGLPGAGPRAAADSLRVVSAIH
jgi:2-isopropylmalate synthase